MSKPWYGRLSSLEGHFLCSPFSLQGFRSEAREAASWSSSRPWKTGAAGWKGLFDVSTDISTEGSSASCFCACVPAWLRFCSKAWVCGTSRQVQQCRFSSSKERPFRSDGKPWIVYQCVLNFFMRSRMNDPSQPKEKKSTSVACSFLLQSQHPLSTSYRPSRALVLPRAPGARRRSARSRRLTLEASGLRWEASASAGKKMLQMGLWWLGNGYISFIMFVLDTQKHH